MEFQVNINRKGKQPVYLQIRDQLKQQIIRRRIPADTQLPNVKIIAELSGCSLRTADLALQALVEDGVCYRRPKQGTFVSPSSVSNIRHICGIWSVLKRQDINQNMLTSSLVHEAVIATEQSSQDITMFCDDPEDTIRFYNGLPTFEFDGLLVVEPENFPRMLELAAEFPHIRFVILNYFLRFPEDCPKNVFSVTNNDSLGSFMLMQHYVSEGIRKFAVFKRDLPYNDLTYQERLNGFLQAVEAFHLPFRPETDIVDCKIMHPDDIPAAGYRAAKQYIEAGNMPEAICSVNELLARGIREYLDEKGLSDRIRVSGYGRSSMNSEEQNLFDSVIVDYPAMSRVGVGLLQQKSADTQRIMLPPQLALIR